MRARFMIFSVTFAISVAAGAFHWRAQRTQAALESDRGHLLAAISEPRRLADQDARRAAAAQRDVQTLAAERAGRDATRSASSAATTTARAAASPAPKSAAVVTNPELRRWQVQAFVSDQRLRFVALLRGLGFTPEKLQSFDRIVGDCQLVQLDDSQPAAIRQHAREKRDAQLKELFGENHDRWLEANRNEPARAMVNRIVQQTFQGSGALTTAQADELTRIVAQHRLPPAKEAGGGQTRYDWDRIVSDAHSILAERQQQDFAVAVEFRRVSEKMSAIAAGKK